MMKIEEIQIKGLFGKKDICWKLNPQVNVLVGVNGSGKSTILSTVYCMLNNIPNSNKSMIFDIAKISFNGTSHNTIVRKNNTLPSSIDVDIVSADIARQLENIISQHIMQDLNSISNNKVKQKAISDFKSNQHNLREKLFNDIYEKFSSNAQDVDGKKVILTQKTEQYAESEKIFNALNITMISTLNLSANAIFEFKGSNEEVLNILDLEMDKVLNQFNYKNDNEVREKLINTLNFFLNMVDKYAKYEENRIIYYDKEIGKELKFSDLSSGERQLIYMLVQVALNSTEKEKSSIILMDEPEISLHIDWQEHFIHQLITLSPNTQFIIVTHNPALIMNGWNAVYLDIEEITQ